MRKSVTIDWTLRESARAKIRVMVKRILNKLRLPARLAGRSGEDRADASGVALCGVGRVKCLLPKNRADPTNVSQSFRLFGWVRDSGVGLRHTEYLRSPEAAAQIPPIGVRASSTLEQEEVRLPFNPDLERCEPGTT